MKLYHPGEKGQAICDTDGRVSTTFKYRDVPFSDGSGTSKHILVGVCDQCGKVVAVPPQSTPAIKAARRSAEVPMEAILPAIYMEALDLACYRIGSNVSLEFRKTLLLYFLHRSSRNKATMVKLARTTRDADRILGAMPAMPDRRRLSMKVSAEMDRTVGRLMQTTNLSKTDLIKGVVAQIKQDIVEPDHPAHLKELQTLAVLTGC